jgi:hypothetical protein
MKTITSLIPNVDFETRKTRTRHMQNKNPTFFFYKEKENKKITMIRKCTQNWC